MGAKHRMPESLERQAPPAEPAARRKIYGVARVCDIVTGSMVCAACVTALALNLHGAQPEKRTVVATQESPSVSQPVSQEGTVVAVTPGSVTTRSADGFTQTYLVTPNTTVITSRGRQPLATAGHFTVNDRVVVVGRMQGGMALATAVADRDGARGDGPPMDYVDTQSITRAHSPN
ncbi:MAG: hypothetical protein JOZ00_09240 [Mycobacterium sp.]|uniref:hypothetical protein n=1 Tax=Mycobacterium sp. TaxID=1785 RepID=UPI001EB8C123|nr:hypothetical protein [Mycobacterium sp.]MBV8786858.1 hypothetical protein [Mycobacterium sp.]